MQDADHTDAEGTDGEMGALTDADDDQAGNDEDNAIVPLRSVTKPKVRARAFASNVGAMKVAAWCEGHSCRK